MLLLGFGCSVPDVDLEGRPCPCIANWYCDLATNRCVRDLPRDAAAPRDALIDAAVEDAGAEDAGADACPTSSVTEVWGDAASSDHPGTLLDTWINLNPETHASDVNLRLYTWPAAQIANAILVKVDLAAVPPGASVEAATLELYQHDAVGVAYTTTAHGIVRCDPDIAGDAVTGFECRAGVEWTPSSCCRMGVPMGQSDIGPAVDARPLDEADGYKAWSITALVQQWLEVPADNLGLMINSDPGAAADERRTFYSTEHPGASQRPRLTLTYRTCE
jgi:hypothetical protein